MSSGGDLAPAGPVAARAVAGLAGMLQRPVIWVIAGAWLVALGAHVVGLHDVLPGS